MVDAASGGSLIDKTPEEAQHLISTMAENYRQYGYHTERGVSIVNEEDFRATQRRYDPHSNFYNPGWRDHPNFSYRNHGEQSKPQPLSFNRPNPAPQAPPQAPNSGMSLEDIVKSLAVTNQQFQQKAEVGLQETKAELQEKSRMSKSKEEEHAREILDTFKKVEINIPLLDAIKQIPKYAKFLKELCTNKRKLKDKERIIFGKNVSAVINRKLPEKCKDPGMFTLPCVIGNKRIERAMLDLGASINVMPYSVYQALNLSTLQDTNVIIQLADRSYMGTEGLDNSASVLLGRPFMKTAKTKIDVDEGTLSVEIGGEIVKFNIAEAMKYPNELHALYQVDIIDSVVNDVVEDELVGTELDLIMDMDESDGEDDLVESISEVLKPPLPEDSGYSTTHTKLLPSVLQAPKLELKPLPEHLKYIYLGDEETLPAIISSKLSKEHEERLVTLLREHRTAIGWTLADIRGISPAMCMHRIYLEDNTKPSREPQRRLNPTLKEVVMKEILKLHDADTIKLQLLKKIKRRQLLHVLSAPSLSDACPLAYAMPQVRSSDA
ncbi:UNVERIFIED_CONTAM: hypothetical protein Sradi_3186000 [Sesamum radiatum]|uniref:Aspartic peptidase DDI1-type domain-containing protein n=1 Tax=Sesamum radiatum TaxID=300843 RepID=A0AAW2RFV0_SESRA